MFWSQLSRVARNLSNKKLIISASTSQPSFPRKTTLFWYLRFKQTNREKVYLWNIARNFSCEQFFIHEWQKKMKTRAKGTITRHTRRRNHIGSFQFLQNPENWCKLFVNSAGKMAWKSRKVYFSSVAKIFITFKQQIINHFSWELNGGSVIENTLLRLNV